MNKLTKFVSSLCFVAVAGTASAGDFYLGADIGKYIFDSEGYNTNSMGQAGLRGGYQLNKYFAIEGRLGTGNSQTVNTDLGPLDFNLNGYATGLLKAGVPISNDRLFVHGIGGYTTSRVSIDGSAEDLDAFAYGIGFEFYGYPRDSINFEWLRLMDGEENGVDYRVDTFNIGWIHHFK